MRPPFQCIYGPRPVQRYDYLLDILLRPISRPKDSVENSRQRHDPLARAAFPGPLTNPRYSRMRQPAHAYSGLSITIHHRAGKQRPEGQGSIPVPSRRCILPLAARRAALPVAVWPPGIPWGEDPGCVGARPCVTTARSACAGSLLASRPARWPGAYSGRRAEGRPAGRRQAGPADAGTGCPGSARLRVRIRELGLQAVVRSARTGSAGPATARPGARPGRSGWRPRSGRSPRRPGWPSGPAGR